ncbi:hypothetical protein POKO110462_19990 [Pontibacter korlensis]
MFSDKHIHNQYFRWFMCFLVVYLTRTRLNIFNFFRIDVVRRLTYLNHPNVSDIGIRGRFKFDF